MTLQADFATELAAAIQPLCDSLRKMLIEWGGVRTASALHRLSGAGQTICWQVFRIVNAADIVAESRHAPTPAALKRLLVAAENAGVETDTLEGIRKSAEDFQAFIRDNAADRAAFDSMLAGTAGDESCEKILLRHRRAAYRAMSHLWGIQTDVQLVAAMVRRASADDNVDAMTIVRQQGVRRLRSGTSVTLMGFNKNPVGSAGMDTIREPIDPDAAAEYGAPIWPAYCSQPLPRCETVEMPSGWVLKNLIGDEIGLKASIDCTFASTQRNASLLTDTDGRKLYYLGFAHVRKPVALLTMDLLIHRPSLPGIRPEMIVYQYQDGDPSQEGARRAQQFPLDERIVRIGRGDTITHEETPLYPEMLQKAADVAGWSLGEFDAFRLRIPYPVMGSAVRMFFYV